VPALVVSALAMTGTIAGVAGAGQANAATSGRAAPAAARPAVRAWGTNDDGELGNGTRGAGGGGPVKVKQPAGVTVTSVRAGCDHSVALTSAGKVLTWGDGTLGQLGNGSTKTRTTPVSVKLPAGTTITAVRAACDGNLALTKAGRVLAWGLNNNGQLGDGSTTNRDKPVRAKLPAGVKIKSISATCDSSLALSTTGKVYAWGDGLAGQLGNGAMKSRHTPVKVKLPAGTTATTITGGCNFALALTNTGLYGWGDNAYGQLADGTTNNADTPEPIVFLTRGQPLGKVTGLFAGCEHIVEQFSKGAVLAWGDNSSGQLGNGTTNNSLKPVAPMLPAGTKVASISAGCYNTLARTSSGKVLAWGRNNANELGNGTQTDSDVPVQVPLPAGVSATALGGGPGAQHFLVISKAS
jgi:alpha-tubulin suppressor-like RCC1 family protein